MSPAALKKELEATRSKFNETSEKFLEKSRQYQKLQVHVQTLLYMSVVCIVTDINIVYLTGNVRVFEKVW